MKTDILEQAHFDKNYTQFIDFIMYVPMTISPNEINLIKVIKDNGDEQ